MSNAESSQVNDLCFVKFAPNTSEAERISAVADQLGGTIKRWLPEINTCIVQTPTDVLAHQSSTAKPSTSLPIVHVEPDGVAEGCQSSVLPPFNDPEFDEAYGLRTIEAIDAWQFTTGEGVVIAVLDTGIDADHPEFAGRLLPGLNFVNDGSETADDDQGHGTHVSGVLGAALNNQQGAAGAAPSCRILPVKVLGADNRGQWSDIVTGVLAAVGQNAQVLNMSFGAPAVPPLALQEAVQMASRTAVLVAAAGNNGSDQEFFPAAYADVVGVVATTQNELLWALSNRGPWVTVAAPGQAIFSTARNNQYEFRSGTSMSAAFVSALAALIISQDAAQTPAMVRDTILRTAQPADPLVPAGQIGSGRINAFKALGGTRVFVPITPT